MAGETSREASKSLNVAWAGPSPVADVATFDGEATWHFLSSFFIISSFSIMDIVIHPCFFGEFKLYFSRFREGSAI